MKSLKASEVVAIAAGHRDAQAGQVADHLAQRGILAADPGQVGQAQVVQPQDVLGSRRQDAPKRPCASPKTVGEGRVHGKNRYDAVQEQPRQA